MAHLRSEIHILLSGPENRFFVAYKPQGWFLTTPFDRNLRDGVLAPVLAAKLGVSPRCITFPSKLTAQESGLVVGCTDDSMHRKMTNIIMNGGCSKSYQCIVHANSFNKSGNASSTFKHAYKCFNYRSGISSGLIRFDLMEHDKTPALNSLSSVTDSKLRSNIVQFVARGRCVSVSNVTLDKNQAPCEDSIKDGDIVDGCHKSGGKHKLAFIMENLRDYLKRSIETSDSTYQQYLLNAVRRGTLSQFRHLEIATSDHAVNKHLVEVLSSLGLVVLSGGTNTSKANIHTINSTLCLELYRMQFSHPIYRDRVVDVWVHENNPEVPECWVNHALTTSF
ncbi:hypothetical protein BgAZ_206110 [Babesia gibsoni]|uniref:Uncharacterized protein n=1 Tax=Babesia gibsoni TaxID=33632 RepID=A0AAD8LJ66_BABGI|nr:hypothetical protein BgAZ_206110 [Babesia gibsoni]